MSTILVRQAPVSPVTTYTIRYRTCGHRKVVSLEEYFAAACEAPAHYHNEDKALETVSWTLTYPNADCPTCSPAEKEYWHYNVGAPPDRSKFYDTNYGWCWRAYRERLGLANAMLASASRILGHNVSLGDLFALVGQTGWVRARDYGCDGNPYSWGDDATITKLLPPQRTPVYDEEYDSLSHWVNEPVFDLSGMGRLVYTRLLSDIKLAGASK